MPKKINLNPPVGGKYNFSLRLDYNNNIAIFKNFHDITGISMNETLNKIVNAWVENEMVDYIEEIRQNALAELSNTFNETIQAVNSLRSLNTVSEIHCDDIITTDENGNILTVNGKTYVHTKG